MGEDPLADWVVPSGLLYSERNAKAFVAALMDEFNPKWFHRGALRPDPLRQAWHTRSAPYSALTLCRAGRDVWKLKQRRDPEQDDCLAGLVQRAKTADRTMKGMEDYLHELHTTMLFDEALGAVGKLAPPNQEGYDATVDVPRGRRLWVACKRLKQSESERLFVQTAGQLRETMGTIAARHGHRALDAVVFTEGVLPAIDQERLLAGWTDLCATYDGQAAAELEQDGAYVRVSPSIMLTIPGIDPSTLQSAVAVQFLSAMPEGEHERVRRVIQTAQNQLRASDAPRPSASDAWIVAVQVPRFVSTWTVAELFAKELSGGHFRDIAGVLVMHLHQGGALGPDLTFTIAEQIGLIVNLAGDVTLPDVMASDHLPILVEGYYAPFRPYYQVGEHRFHFDGYVHHDVGPVTFQSVGPSLTVAPPPFIPEVIVAHEELPGLDTETQVPLAFTVIEQHDPHGGEAA